MLRLFWSSYCLRFCKLNFFSQVVAGIALDSLMDMTKYLDVAGIELVVSDHWNYVTRNGTQAGSLGNVLSIFNCITKSFKSPVSRFGTDWQTCVWTNHCVHISHQIPCCHDTVLVDICTSTHCTLEHTGMQWVT